ncbi:MAG TPA: alpha-ketoglutarate-dependent dioxygenase AlkB [Flavisolibacter sp.]|nr:alpha-ketoglutarate-dependent dioxygenase AlkB [Flavisolibacter sp.]
MQSLFPLEPVWPEGFQYVPSFISPEEEAQLMETIRSIDLHTFLFQGYEAKRKVASFGYDWSFEKRTLSKGKPIPEAFQFLVQKVATHLLVETSAIGELLVTEYPAGSVINWHRDAPPFDRIIGISLATDCLFRLRPYDTAKQGRKSIHSIPVSRRSLYILQGASRTEWEHSIAPVKSQRYSITLRTLVQQPSL